MNDDVKYFSSIIFLVYSSMTTYTATTQKITVTVQPIFLESESKPILHKFVFAYIIKIENNSAERVRLLRRYWIITHATGKQEEVRGAGVIGVQPIIFPGKAHEYNSFCILETFEGTMEGTYTMARSNNELFDILIPKFTMRAMAN